MPQWARNLTQVLEREHGVLVTIDLIVGSAPREAGCRMIVTASEVFGSIGGGRLEFEATTHARRLLAQGRAPLQEHRPYALGPALNQCCGGTVTLLFERLAPGVPAWLDQLRLSSGNGLTLVLASAIDRDQPFKAVIAAAGADNPSLTGEVVDRGREMLRRSGRDGIEKLETTNENWWLELIDDKLTPLTLFGAGHVGQAVARLLADLPFDVSWVDGRAGVFPEHTGPNIKAIESESALEEVEKAPPGSIFVVMTHSHQLDEDICFEVFSRGDFAWLGLIGSLTKRRRFVQRLAQRGVSETSLERLVCPIGLSGIRGKQPATIALSLVAQLMHDPEMNGEVTHEQ
jgi:xanthine dehydrogenase accessory factor